MTNYKITIKLTLIIFLFSSCNERKESDFSEFEENKISRHENPLVLHPPMKNGDIVIDSIVLDSKLLFLQTTENTLIGVIDNIIFDEEFIFVADYKKTASLFIFSKDGKFVCKISGKGESQNEYISLDGIDIDKEKKWIYMLDGTKGNLLKWNYDGQFLENIKLPFKNISSFQLKDSHTVYFDFGYRGRDVDKKSLFNLIQYDLDTKEIKSQFFPYDKQIFKLIVEDNFLFTKKRDALFYRTLFGNEIYKLGKDSLVKILEVDFNEYKTPFHCHNLNPRAYQKALIEKGYAKLGKFIDFDDWTYLRIDRGIMNAHYFLNKKNSSDFLDLSHIFVKSKFIAPDIFYCDSVSFCGWITPDRINMFGDFPEEDMSLDNNPVLVFYKLRK